MTGFAIPAVRGASIRNRGGCRASAKRGPECQGKIVYIYSEDEILVDWSTLGNTKKLEWGKVSCR